jgi:hypothetical protein
VADRNRGEGRRPPVGQGRRRHRARRDLVIVGLVVRLRVPIDCCAFRRDALTKLRPGRQWSS